MYSTAAGMFSASFPGEAGVGSTMDPPLLAPCSTCGVALFPVFPVFVFAFGDYVALSRSDAKASSSLLRIFTSSRRLSGFPRDFANRQFHPNLGSCCLFCRPGIRSLVAVATAKSPRCVHYVDGTVGLFLRGQPSTPSSTQIKT